MGATCIVPIVLDSTDCVFRARDYDGDDYDNDPPWRSAREVINTAPRSAKDGLRGPSNRRRNATTTTWPRSAADIDVVEMVAGQET